MPTLSKTSKTRRNEKAPSTVSKRKPAIEGQGGTYVYDKALGKLVRVSDRVPKVASKRGGGAPMPGACGRMGAAGGCGGGACGS